MLIHYSSTLKKKLKKSVNEFFFTINIITTLCEWEQNTDKEVSLSQISPYITQNIYIFSQQVLGKSLNWDLKIVNGMLDIKVHVFTSLHSTD